MRWLRMDRVVVGLSHGRHSGHYNCWPMCGAMIVMLPLAAVANAATKADYNADQKANRTNSNDHVDPGGS